MKASTETSAAPKALLTTRKKARKVKPGGQYHHGDLRQSLIEWSTHLLDTKGVDTLSLRAAARLAGVSSGAPSHHFKDRNGLLAAIAAQAFRDLVHFRMTRLSEVAASDNLGRLRAVVRGYVDFARAHPARFNLMFGGEIADRLSYPDLVQEGNRSYELLKGAVLPLVDPDIDSVSLDELVYMVWAATHGLAMLRINRQRGPATTPRTTTEDLTEKLFRFVIAGIQHTNDTPISRPMQVAGASKRVAKSRA